MKYILLFAITTVIFFSIDLVWLGVIAKNMYRENLGFILSEEVNWTAAIVFYLIYLAGILFFTVVPALNVHLHHFLGVFAFCKGKTAKGCLSIERLFYF